MQLPESWLRLFADPPIASEALAHLLTMGGLEVESCAPVAPPFHGVVAARIVEVARHPGAERLTVCEVDCGDGAPIQVVCGAPNARAGMLAPLAKVGAVLPGEAGRTLEIGVATMRGVESRGMLCSARELGLSQDHSGLLELAADTLPGADLRSVLALDDHVLDISLTPNRGDCLSVLGVAREVAALGRAALTVPEIRRVPAACGARHPTRISAPEGCGRFTGRVIRGVDPAAPSPEWMRRRLERCGQRSISALVDVTNYVMLELGRPLHVYDLDKLRGPIDVRFGRAGERVRLLNEQEVAVDETVLCITDDSGPIGLAGIMGGESTGAGAGTRNIFLESAFFFPEAVAGRSRRFNFTSDAAHRFERGVDFDNNVAGIERATRLILDICGGEAGPTEDLVARLPERRPVRMRVARAQKIIGVPVPAAEMADAFTRLGLPFRREGTLAAESFVVAPPSYRFDLETEEDLIEEVARVYGFERITAHPPRVAAQMRPAREGRRSLHQLRERLADSGYQEVINFSFVEPAWEADFGAGAAEPITAQPDREPALGDAQHAAGQPGRQPALQRGAQAVAHTGVRGRARLPARPGRARRAAVGPRPAPADSCRRSGIRSGARRAMGHCAARGRFLRCKGGPRGAVRAASPSVRARAASGVPSRALGAGSDRRPAGGLDRGTASEMAGQVRIAAAGGAFRGAGGGAAGPSPAPPGAALPLPVGGARPRDPGRFRSAGAGHPGRDFGRKTGHRAAGGAFRPVPGSEPSRGRGIWPKKPCFPGSYARY